MALYALALMGAPTEAEIAAVEQNISAVTEGFGLRLGHEIEWTVGNMIPDLQQRTPTAIAFFGRDGQSTAGLDRLLRAGIPTIPVATSPQHISADIPAELKGLNCLTFSGDGALRIATALLECVGLLPRQRRVFLSYRRTEARQAALQLFDVLSARVYEVFLDTHGILPGEDFQAALWHRLCDSDVLIMLDTPEYFESRWTTAEYGRALAKGISVLRVGWPGVNPSKRTATASRVDLLDTEIDTPSGQISEDALERIACRLEKVRSQSHAVRSLNLFSNLKNGIECIGGTISGVGPHNAVHLLLPDDTAVVAYPTVGVPTAVTLNDPMDRSSGDSVAIVFDDIGLQPKWMNHLNWLGTRIPAVKWVKVSEAAWSFGGWGTL